MSDAPGSAIRIDKWLWAARFFKTRGLAAEAVGGGKVHVDGQRVKPSRRVRAGETLVVRRGVVEWEVIVRGVRAERRPAPEAQALYEETAASLARRTSEAERRAQAARRRGRGLGRPTKKDRRDIDRLRDGD